MKKLFSIALAGAAAATTASAAEFKLPAFETARLPNGLTVYMMERHDVPLVAVRAVVKAGAVNDGAQAGLANLTGDGVLLGSAKHGKAQIDQAFDFRGAMLSGGGSVEQSTVAANFARKDTDVLLPLFAELVQEPSFDAAELDKLRTRKVNGLKQAKESPRQVVGTYYRAMLFGNAAYANPPSGTVNSLSALKQEDVKAFHQRYFDTSRSQVSGQGAAGSARADDAYIVSLHQRVQYANRISAWRARSST